MNKKEKINRTMEQDIKQNTEQDMEQNIKQSGDQNIKQEEEYTKAQETNQSLDSIQETSEQTTEISSDKPSNELISNEDLTKSEAALKYMTAKLELINSELSEELNRKVASSTSGRVKSLDSILNKLKRKKVAATPENVQKKINDLIGVRMICFFVDDLYKVKERLEKHKDITIVKVKDYVKQPKKSGYRSLHLICKLIIPFHEKEEEIKIEIQLRTNAMDYWAQLDYQLQYKKETSKSEQMEQKLKVYANEIEAIDKKMMKLRDKIDEL